MSEKKQNKKKDLKTKKTSPKKKDLKTKKISPKKTSPKKKDLKTKKISPKKNISKTKKKSPARIITKKKGRGDSILKSISKRFSGSKIMPLKQAEILPEDYKEIINSEIRELFGNISDKEIEAIQERMFENAKKEYDYKNIKEIYIPEPEPEPIDIEYIPFKKSVLQIVPQKGEIV